MDPEGAATATPTASPATGEPLSSSELLPDLDALVDLASRGQWRSLSDRLSRSRSLPSLLPHHRLLLSSLTALSLFKLRRFSDAAAALDPLLSSPDSSDPFDSPRFRFESYPDHYPSRSGSFVPFALRLLHAELPQRLGDRPQTLDRLYSLLDLVRSRIPHRSAGSADQWRRREAQVMAALCANHFTHREFDVALALIRGLLERDPADPALLSRLGYVQLQIGDLDGARASFARVEEMRDARRGDPGFENLLGRNRALGFVVAKDFASAVREYEACIERDPADVVAVNNKALCLMYSRDLSDSIKVLEGALESVPTAAVNETLIVNLCSMYELAYVNHGEIKKTLSSWIARVAPDDFDPSCTRI
ncbi:trafficking protein particle complex subunit 12 [Ananas comosus]|uniref:Trafficking protein particle complex subunit 12 n=1 Tax=Ananas comosus TaxID=4615 RepID=A0A6P5GM43_ANACO|nr:trafficking protein particle complex subunit 12 [Ananas comosus]XP_020107074.1 trafficking protein particle complex subunit 12 [Ananas comosus]